MDPVADTDTVSDTAVEAGAVSGSVSSSVPLTDAQLRYLQRGLGQAGGKLPLFDTDGQRIKDSTIRACIKAGLCQPWYRNPIKEDWLVCKLTAAGRAAVENRPQTLKNNRI